MRTIVIGDVHGLETWRNVLEHAGDYDHVVFIGDYVDSYNLPDNIQEYNLREIIDFKASNPDTTTLLLGNHDMHYINDNLQCSGFSFNKYRMFHKIYIDNLDKFKMVHRQGDFIFSHAGLSSSYVSFYVDRSKGLDHVVDYLNDRLKSNVYAFDFYYGDASYCGDHPLQGPTWIRPDALVSANKGSWLGDFIQVFGHTQSLDSERFAKDNNWKYVCTDVLWDGKYLVIDSSDMSYVNLFSSKSNTSSI